MECIYDQGDREAAPELRCRKCGEPITYRQTWGPNMSMERKPVVIDGMCSECAWLEGAD